MELKRTLEELTYFLELVMKHNLATREEVEHLHSLRNGDIEEFLIEAAKIGAYGYEFHIVIPYAREAYRVTLGDQAYTVLVNQVGQTKADEIVFKAYKSAHEALVS